MTTLRTFIALPLPDEAKVVLRSVAQALSARVPNKAVRFVRPEQIHLTLRFLGDTNVDQLPAIMDVVDRIADGRAPILLQLDEVGCFPNAQRPRVIWVGLTGEINQLQALKSDLDRRLLDLGWPLEDKPFRAHLTLGRVKDERGVRGVDWSVEVPRIAVSVETIQLIESQLRPDGPLYTVRHAGHLDR